MFFQAPPIAYTTFKVIKNFYSAIKNAKISTWKTTRNYQK